MATAHALAKVGAALLFLAIGVTAASMSRPQQLVRIPMSSPSPSLAPLPVPSPEPVSLVFGGDVMLGRFVETQLRRYGYDWVTDSVAPVFAAADVRVVNLESPFRAEGRQTANGSMVFRADPAAVAVLKNLNTSLVSLANNHITDMGVQGLRDTKATLEAAGIAYTGASELPDEVLSPVIKEVKGQRFGFLSATYGVNFQSAGVHYAQLEDPALMEAVANLKTEGVVPIVLLHWGAEYQAKPSASQEELARRLHENGALLVVGAHPHVPQPARWFGEGMTFYSLGNLIFDQDPGNWRDRSAILRVTVLEGQLRDYELIPYQIEMYAKPVLVEGDAANRIVERFSGS